MKSLLTTLLIFYSAYLLGQVTVDFTDPIATPTYGTDAQLIVEINSNQVAMMWGGDTNGDGQIIYVGNTDITTISAEVFLNPLNNPAFDPTLPVFNAYSEADTNMDGQVIYVGDTDITTISASVFLHPGNTLFDPTFIINQQMPQE